MQLAGLRDRVQADPWDAEAWKQLVAAAPSQPHEVQKAIYEDLLGRFPTAVSLVLPLQPYLSSNRMTKPCLYIVSTMLFLAVLLHASAMLAIWYGYW